MKVNKVRRCDRCGKLIRLGETYTQQGFPDFQRLYMLCRACYLRVSQEIRRKVAEQKRT